MFAGSLKKSLPRSPFVFILVFLISLAGCASLPAKSVFPPRTDQQPVKVALVQFQTIRPDEFQHTVVCPLTGTIYRGCDAPKETEQSLEKYFTDALERFYNRNLIPAERTQGIYRRLASGSFKVSQAKILKNIGEELNADAVLTGYLFCFRERVGYDYAAEKPASVAFGIYLIRVSDGSLIWKGVFDKTQRSLFEDMLQFSSFVKEGGKWVQADVLLREGVDEVLKTFPDLH